MTLITTVKMLPTVGLADCLYDALLSAELEAVQNHMENSGVLNHFMQL